MAVQTRRSRSGESKLVPRDVVRVRVRDETARLPTADIDAHLGLSQK